VRQVGLSSTSLRKMHGQQNIKDTKRCNLILDKECDSQLLFLDHVEKEVHGNTKLNVAR
jgi:hypothetical protein